MGEKITADTSARGKKEESGILNKYNTNRVTRAVTWECRGLLESYRALDKGSPHPGTSSTHKTPGTFGVMEAKITQRRAVPLRDKNKWPDARGC